MSNPILAEDVEPENVEWLWRERIPRSMFSMIAGRPDQGKSMMAAHIAADVTKAGGNVLYSSLERSFGLIERPRLEAAGAVLSRVHACGPGTGYHFTLPKQLDELAELIIDKSIDLVVMDPVSAHFSGVSRASDSIREVLTPLAEIINDTGTAVLFIEHALKRVAANAHPLNAVAGSSSGLPAACAMAFLFGTDPHNEEAKVLAAVKNNIRDRPQALQFEVDECEVDGIDAMVPSLIFDQELAAFDPIRLVSREASHPGKVGRPSDKRAAAAEWLTNYLVDKGGPTLAKTVQEDAKQFGMSGRTLRRAAQDMGIVKNPVGGGPNCKWELPEELLELLKENDDEAVEEAGEQMAENLDEPTVDDDELNEFLKGLND